MNNAANKWQHDGIERNESWWFGPDGCEPSEALATVSPEWGPTRCSGVGKPDQWIARNAKGERICASKDRRTATRIAAEAVAPRVAK